MTVMTKVTSNMPNMVGGWIVKPDGIEFVAEPFFGEGHGYFISYRQFFVTDWLEHLREKTWFSSDIERDFLEAYYRCTRLAMFEMFQGRSFSVSGEVNPEKAASRDVQALPRPPADLTTPPAAKD